MVPHATLKVFEPLDAFDDRERNWWNAYVSAGPSGPAPGTLLLSRERGLGAPAQPTERDHGDVIVADRLYVCPGRTRLRLLASVLAFRRLIPTEVVGSFMPPGEAERAARELQTVREEHPDWRNHILTSAWEVPVRWFVAFDDGERELDEDGPSMRYRATMSSARRRTGRALEAAKSAMVGPQVVGLVSDLAMWLDQFHDDSIVEMNYGSVARLLGLQELRRDHSAADIQEAVGALGAGDLLRATSFYMRAVERWAALSGRDRAN